MTFQVNRAASQPMPLPLATKHMDPLVMAHETISDLAFLFTIWSTELTIGRSLSIGKRNAFLDIQCYHCQCPFKTWEVVLLIKFALLVFQIIADSTTPSK